MRDKKPWWILPGLTLLSAAIIHSASAARAANSGGSFQVKILAEAMCCSGCAQNVSAQLYAAPGVTSVETDVPNRFVTITAKPSPKLTLERLWRAVEKGKGNPSKLTTSTATYVLTRPENIPSEERLETGRYSIEVRSLQDKVMAQKIANQVYAIRGVQSASVDLAQRRLFVESAKEVVISPWDLAAAADRAQSEPIAIGGPHGVLTIERPTNAKPTMAVKPTYPQIQGGIR